MLQINYSGLQRADGVISIHNEFTKHQRNLPDDDFFILVDKLISSLLWLISVL